MPDIKNYSIFGNYSKKENRVTEAFLQIIDAGGEDFVNFFLQKRNKQLPKNEMLVETQYDSKSTATADGKDGTGESVPDGRISCKHSYTLFIESKISNNIDQKQMSRHLNNLKEECGQVKYLIYITKGPRRPKELENMILWYSWEESYNIATEYQKADRLFYFLVEQFRMLLEPMGLIDTNADDRVIIVGGRYAEGEAENYGFYACQEYRTFRKAKYMAFYTNKHIKYLYEIVGDPEPSILKTEIPGIISSGYQVQNSTDRCEYFKLKLLRDDLNIINDSTDQNGQVIPFAQNTRYTTFSKIMKAKKTSELI